MKFNIEIKPSSPERVAKGLLTLSKIISAFDPSLWDDRPIRLIIHDGDRFLSFEVIQE